MNKIALPHNHFDIDHLVKVIAEMQTLGAPVIRVVHVDGDLYQAIEGSHRLRAAAALGLTPDFDEIDQDTLRSDIDGLDFEDGECGEDATVGSIGDWENDTIIFEGDI